MKFKHISFVDNIPLIFTIIYLLLTLFLFQFGPIAWKTYNPVYFWTLQFMYILFFALGWQFSKKRKCEKKLLKSKWGLSFEDRILNYIWIFLSINLVVEVINLFRRFYMTSFDFLELFSRIQKGLFNMGDSYSNFQIYVGIHGSEVVGGTIMTLINYCWQFFGFMILLLGILLFKKLKTKDKILEFLTIFVIVIGYVSTGTNIGVFRIVVAIIVFGFISILKYRKNAEKNDWIKKRNRLLIISVLLIIISALLFNAIMLSRGGILSWKSSSYNIGGFPINYDSFLINILPDGLIMFLISATAYLTQGYVGMSMSLMLTWEPTFGIGFSKALTDLSSKYVTNFFEISSYTYRVEQTFGWDADIHWHSMYTWFANDLTFIGVIFVMGILGYLLYKVYNDSLNTDNPFAQILFYYLVILIFFIPCNNQIFQSASTMFSFFTTLILWLYFRGTLDKISLLKRKKNYEK